MTSQTSKDWRRAITGTVASSALAVGLLLGLGSQSALAEPADPTTETDTPPTAQAGASAPMTADEALAIIAEDYDMGAGGGQLSNLIHDVLALRAQGFKASNANRLAIQKALDYRPNQAPLIKALQETLAYQLKVKAQAANAQPAGPGGVAAGINQLPPGMNQLPSGMPPGPTAPDNTGVFIAPGGSIQQPIGP
jgi:hypothetical protein